MKFSVCEGSGELSASKIVESGSCFLSALRVYTDGVNDVTVALYNSNSATGEVVDKLIVNGEDNYGGGEKQRVKRCRNGLYAYLSGTGGSMIVDFIKAPR